MLFNSLFVIFVLVAVLNYIFLDIKIYKLNKEIIEKNTLLSAFAVLDKSIKKLNEGFKDHERRLNNIEEVLLSEKREKPEEPDRPEFTCQDCEFYRALYSNYYMCNQTGCFCTKECNKPCELFKKKESLDENIVYANNVKIDISSKEPKIYKTDRIFTTYEDYADLIRKLYLYGGINFADAQIILERLKQ